jgi:hypothetical protein
VQEICTLRTVGAGGRRLPRSLMSISTAICFDPFWRHGRSMAQMPVRVLSADEIQQMLMSHRLYLKTAIVKATELIFPRPTTGLDFAGLNLRGNIRIAIPVFAPIQTR